MDYIVLLLGCVAPVVRCYGSGKVTDSCDDLRPRHAALSPQTDPAPFTVAADRSGYRLGEEVKVQLQAPGSTPFMGFLLQAREVGGQSPVGSFALTAGAAQLLACGLRPNSAVSHRSESAKTSIRVSWRSDASGDGKPIQFHASFVQNYRTFWVDVTSRSLGFINDSTGGSASPTAPTHTSELPPAQPAEGISGADCGVTKVCFSQPPSCDPAVSGDCYFMSAVATSPPAVRYEMTGPSDGYISFGFSDDRTMGNDDLYICGIDGGGRVRLQHAFSTGRTAPRALTLGNVSGVRASVRDSVISCSFTSTNAISTQRRSGADKAYHLMFAHGPSRNGQIQFHAGSFVSSDKIDISRPQSVAKAGWPRVLKAHGALMLAAWTATGSLGMVTARYLRGATEARSLWGKDVWFLAHAAVMSVATAATVVAFVLPFCYVKAWSEGAHPVLGCLVMILTLVQPIVALLRCGPQHPLRFLFNWSHALNALAIKALAVAAIFTGLKMIDSTPDQWLMKTMGGFVGWEALLYVLLEAHSKWKGSSTDPGSKTITIVLLVALFCLGNCTFLAALLVGIGKS
ncbi:putative ferric-chelate reductase 1 [Scophthalmus maximus]|uniref:Putative ferric-chelate reductase 1 n=1 Tax=Scophthalmus maximus TaxID=52904 RepID=A0A2U9CZ74_SCOMX|nr:putative ferric-chelate reductase 1 [Scophthalmus maximus]